MTTARREILALCSSSLLVVVALLCMYRRGMTMSSDGWLYWQAAASIRSGAGYCDFWGQAIPTWPPGFSVWLALWQLALGTSGQALSIAVAGTTGLAALGFGVLLHAVGKREGASFRTRAGAHGVACVLLVMSARDPRAEQLLHAILPLFLYLCWRLARAQSHRALYGWTAAALLVLAPMLTVRYPAICFAPGLAWLALLRARQLGREAQHAWQTRGLLPCAVLASSAGFVVWLRASLSQSSGYPVGLGVARYGPWEYAAQLVLGLDANGGVQVLGGLSLAIACALFLSRRERDSLGRAALVMCALALLTLYALFNVTYIHDELDGRMTAFAPLTLLPLAVLAAGRSEHPRLLPLLLVMTLVAPSLRQARHVARGRGPQAATYDERALRAFFPRDAYLAHAEREPGRCVPPPHFDWLHRPRPRR